MICSYLESISSSLLHLLRPLIQRENRVDTLAELCNSLIFHLKGPEEDEDRVIRQDSKTKAIKAVVEAILNDTQSRLYIKAKELIQSEIRLFKPREKEMMMFSRGPDRNLLPDP